jgi:hypothetical protein
MDRFEHDHEDLVSARAFHCCRRVEATAQEVEFKLVLKGGIGVRPASIEGISFFDDRNTLVAIDLVPALPRGGPMTQPGRRPIPT